MTRWDGLVFVGSVLVLVGLALYGLPLVVVFVGASMIYIGMKKA